MKLAALRSVSDGTNPDFCFDIFWVVPSGGPIGKPVVSDLRRDIKKGVSLMKKKILCLTRYDKVIVRIK